MRAPGTIPGRRRMPAVGPLHYEPRSAGTYMDATQSTGSLVCVGIGMTLGSHIGTLARNQIEQADVVFTGVSDGVVELWLRRMNNDVRSLQPYYCEGKSRLQTYRQMVDAMLT